MMKEVRYDLWCRCCKYLPMRDWDDPCNECLLERARPYSHKPVKFEASKKSDKTQIRFKQEIMLNKWANKKGCKKK